ncbi:MAG: hypothetical protein IIW21_04140 [Clostridia bacterium]|nr:hypothetical protein [Clostridia bacterium]
MPITDIPDGETKQSTIALRRGGVSPPAKNDGIPSSQSVEKVTLWGNVI